MLIFFFVLWIVLNGRITLELVVLGIIVAAAVFLFAQKAFHYSLRGELLVIRYVPLAILYFFNLILEIVKATLAVAKIIVSPARKPDPILVEFDSGLATTFQNSILANSITLTPGTVTVKMDGDHFMVHCLVPEFADGMEMSSFVKLLQRIKM